MFAFAGLVIWYSSEPFAEGLKMTGTVYGINQFLLVQWLAPLASESPEAMIALLFALKGKGSTGIGALISSKVNQWTLLVGAIPLAYALAVGGWGPMVLNHQQQEELLLTSAQSLFAAVVISDFRFALWEALLLTGAVCRAVLFPAGLHPGYFQRPLFAGRCYSDFHLADQTADAVERSAVAEVRSVKILIESATSSLSLSHSMIEHRPGPSIHHCAVININHIVARDDADDPPVFFN
jgi:hypothetical protein